MSSLVITSAALVPSTVLKVMRLSCCRDKGLPIETQINMNHSYKLHTDFNQVQTKFLLKEAQSPILTSPSKVTK